MTTDEQCAAIARECDHPSQKKFGPYFQIGEKIRELGFNVPCSGLAGDFYAQVWNP